MFFELHCHTDEGSNLRLLDTTNKVKTVMNYAAEIGLGGVAITDHESLSAHINALNHLAKVKEKYPDFKLILGNEIYLIDEADYQNTDKFFHFILLAKDKVGHRQLRELSTRAWERSYTHKGLERVPTFKEDLVEIVKNNPGHLIASTACLGGEWASIVAEGDVPKSIDFCDFFYRLFGDDFYVELQPGISNEQVNFNVKAMKFCKHFNYPWIITNDVHYLNPEKRELHTAFLNAKDGDRETADFYESTYFKTEEEMFKRMKFYLNEEDILKGFENTVEIAKKIEDYDLFQSTIVPQRELPEFEVQHLFKSWYDECPSLKYCAYSPYEQDRFLVSECEKGAYNRGKNINEELAKRLNVELEQILGISEKLNQRLSSYYNLDQLVVQLMWQVSFVGPARGSAAGFEICYLLGITQVDPMEWDLPYWRHLSKFRPELPDIDSDTEAAKRPDVFKTIIGHFGRDRCLNIATFRKETAKSAMLTACRGLGIDIDDARELASMIPMVRGKVYSIDECINGCEDNGYVPVSGFESKVLSYPNLLETVKEIEGLVSGRGVHASGLYIFSQPFVEQNALMKAPNGTWTTCWNMGNSDQCGALKIDCLTVESLDRIHKCIDLLIEDGLIEDKGSIRENYDDYISPEVLDYDASEMWDAAGNDEICDLFQMATTVGREAMVKIKPRSLKQVSVSSSVMRLMGNEDMIPIDRYASFIQDINLWYQEMKDAGLNEDEVKVLEKHLLSNNGASIEQEDLMTLLMDEKISGFDIVWSNKARKGLAKRNRELIEQVSKKYYEDGEKLGTRKQMLDYVWKYCLKPQLGYSFSRLHSIGYAHITLQEMNLYHRYPHIYWQTACLTINASANEDVEDGKSTNYGKVASAISNMQLNGVKIALPLINQAKFGFSPDRENNQIIFGLKGLNGVGDDAVRLIVAKRPYASFDDFLKKTSGSIDTKCIINLIKAGCFDELEPSMSRERLMNVYAYHLGYSKAGLKESLNMQNFPSIAELDIVPPAFDFEKRLYYFKKYVFSKHNEVEKNVYLMDTEAKAFFDAELYRSFKEGEHYIISENGDYALLKKSFDKYYKSAVNRLVEWVTNPSIVAVYNESALENYVNNLHSKYCEGNKSKWEMDSLSFYHSKHELADLDEDSYGISSWDSIPEEPVVESVEEKVNKKGEVSQFVKYRLYKIAGTVLDKNANGHSITLLTPSGVATVKFYDGAFTHYSKQVSVIDPDSGKKKVIEKSWFDRGTKLLITGIRRGDTFFPKRYFDSVYQHTVCKIENVSEDGKYMELKYDRERSE